MSWDSDIAADLATVILNTDEMGESVTYTPAATGTGTAVDCQWFEMGRGMEDDEGTERELIEARVLMASADVTPVIGDSITRGGLEYTVRKIEGVEQGGAVVIVQRGVAKTHARSGHRRRFR